MLKEGRTVHILGARSRRKDAEMGLRKDPASLYSPAKGGVEGKNSLNSSVKQEKERETRRGKKRRAIRVIFLVFIVKRAEVISNRKKKGRSRDYRKKERESSSFEGKKTRHVSKKGRQVKGRKEGNRTFIPEKRGGGRGKEQPNLQLRVPRGKK